MSYNEELITITSRKLHRCEYDHGRECNNTIAFARLDRADWKRTFGNFCLKHAFDLLVNHNDNNFYSEFRLIKYEI